MNFYTVRLIIIMIVSVFIIFLIKIKKLEINYKALMKRLILLFLVLTIIPFENLFIKRLSNEKFINYVLFDKQVIATEENDDSLFVIYVDPPTDLTFMGYRKGSIFNKIRISLYTYTEDAKIEYGTLRRNNQTYLLISPQIPAIPLDIKDNRNSDINTITYNNQTFYTIVVKDFKKDYQLTINGKEVHFI